MIFNNIGAIKLTVTLDLSQGRFEILNQVQHDA
jgi:hypothetical protein